MPVELVLKLLKRPHESNLLVLRCHGPARFDKMPGWQVTPSGALVREARRDKHIAYQVRVIAEAQAIVRLTEIRMVGEMPVEVQAVDKMATPVVLA